MKLRIHENSLRLRLNQADVARLEQDGRVVEAVEFGPNARFTYSLESSGKCGNPRASYRDGSLKVEVPAESARIWAASDQVAISGEQEGADKPLSILIEKDFKCAHRDSEEDQDAYPNPLATRA